MISCAAVSAADVDNPIISEPQDSISLEEGVADDVDIVKAAESEEDSLNAAIDDDPVLSTSTSDIPIYDDTTYEHHHVYDVQPTDVGEEFLSHIVEVSGGVFVSHPQHPTNVYWTGVKDGTMYIILDMGGNEHFKINKLKGITGLSGDYEVLQDIQTPSGKKYTTICLIRFDNIVGTTSNAGLTIIPSQRDPLTITGIKIYNQTNITLYVNDKFEDTIYLGKDATLKGDVVFNDTGEPVTTGIVYYYLYSVNGSVKLDMNNLPNEEPIGNSTPGGTIPYIPNAIGDYVFVAWYPEDDVGHNFESHSNIVILHVIEPPKLDLSVVKKVNLTEDASPAVGDSVKFTIEVTNTDENNDASDVVVNDKLPEGLLFVSSSDPNNYNNVTGDWNVGSLAAGETKTLEIVAKVTTVSEVTNIATITACAEEDTNPENNVSSVTLKPHPEGISLMVTKEVSNSTPLYGDDITYTITVKNIGSTSAHEIEVTDVLPSELIFKESSDSDKYDSSSGVWNVGTLDAGASATLTITATVDTIDPVVNTAKITHHSALEYDPVTEDDEASVTIYPVRKFNLRISKELMSELEKVVEVYKSSDVLAATGNPVYGQEITYVITLHNDGPCEATDIEVTDVLPGGLNFVSADCSDGTYARTGQRILWTIDSLAVDGTATLTINATIQDVGLINNTVEITKYNGTDTDEDDNDDYAELTADPQYDLEVTITVTNPEVLNGQVVEYIIGVINHGPCYAENVIVYNICPSEFIYISDNSTDESYSEKRSSYLGKLLGSASGFDQSTGEWNVGVMNSGDHFELAILAQATKAGKYSIDEKVVADNYQDYDTDLENNYASADVLVKECADLILEKSVDKTEITVGETVTYTFTATNNGPDNATGVTMSDSDITKHTFVSVDGEGYDSSTGVWTVGNLSVGETKTLSVTVQINDVGEFANTAFITCDQDDNDTSNNNASSDNVTVTEPPVDPVDPVEPVEPDEPDEPAKEVKEAVLPKAGNPLFILLIALMILTGAMFERKE